MYNIIQDVKVYLLNDGMNSIVRYNNCIEYLSISGRGFPPGDWQSSAPLKENRSFPLTNGCFP